MILELLLFTAMSTCPETKLIDKTGTGFNSDDMRSAKHAAKTCSQRYPRSPCLIKFMKKGERNYYACCGKPDSEGENCGF